MNPKDYEAGVHVLERQVAAYNAHDVDALLECFGEAATLLDEAWGDSFQAHDALRRHYQAEFEASSDIRLVVGPIFSSADEIAAEFRVQGTHTGSWRGLPATGNPFDIRLWTAMRFTSHGHRIRQLRYDYDRATVLSQLGLLHDPATKLGTLLTALTHPVTMAKAARKRISERPSAHH